MIEVLVQSWLLLTGVCVALLALVIGAQWSMATARRVHSGLRGGVADHVPVTPLRVISVVDQVPAASPRLLSVAGK